MQEISRPNLRDINFYQIFGEITDGKNQLKPDKCYLRKMLLVLVTLHAVNNR